jgi:shikimate kinase
MMTPFMNNTRNKEFRVIAFVGPAGTGKSQRAQLVARENEVDFMIDDGLLISKGRIMAGKSAKSERNLVRAIRRAMFQFPDHRKAVRTFLEKNAPCKIMVLGTSISMAEKIARALALPTPELFIDITEVASPEDIINARRERHEKRAARSASVQDAA